MDEGPAHQAVASMIRMPAKGRPGAVWVTSRFPRVRRNLGRIEFAESRRWFGRAARPRPGDSVGRKRVGERAVSARRPDTARVEVWVVQDGPAVVDLRDRNPKCRGEFYDLFRGVPSGPVTHDLVPLLHSLVPSRSERPGDVLLEEVVALDHQQEGLELLTGVGIETDPTVGRGLDRGQFSHARRSRDRWTAGECVVQVDESAGAEMACFHQRTVDDFAAAVLHGREGTRPSHRPPHNYPGPIRRRGRLLAMGVGLAAPADPWFRFRPAA